MIKKLLLTTTLIISGTILLNAQCTPDPQYTTPGIYPDTVTNLPHAIATIAYSTTITVVVPVDTFYMGQVINIDSVGITSITGLPTTGFTYTPNTLNGYWHGGISGCVLISGTPTQVQIGTHHLTINTMTHVLGFQIPNAVAGYKIVIDSSSAGIANMNIEKFAVSQNSPNPFSLKTTIEFTSPDAEVCQFTVYNLLGEVVYKQFVNAISGDNKIEFSAASLPSGIYMYQINNKAQTVTRRMIIEGK